MSDRGAKHRPRRRSDRQGGTARIEHSRVAKRILFAGLAGVAVILIEIATAAGIVFFGNSEYFERGYQSIVVSGPRTEAIVARLIVHKISTDENSVEVSVLLEATGEIAERLPRGRQPCLILSVDDRSHERLFQPRQFIFDCERAPGEGFIARQTPRFDLPAWQSVTMYPFDDVETLPLLYLATAGGEVPPTRYIVAKTMPGRVLSQQGTELNWEIHLARSANQQIAIMSAAIMFIAIALFAAWQITRAKTPMSGLDNVLAVAGFVVAASGFRTLLGVDRLPGTSAFEIAVFTLPLILLALSILAAGLRSALASR
jgi:hypothetical protein